MAVVGLLVLAALAAFAGVAAELVASTHPGLRATAPISWAGVRPGADASWPSCTPPHGTRRTLPLASRPAFVVVGVNDGLPGTRSACIARELRWADTATGGSSQPRLAYYVMAADPWTKPQRKWTPHPDWPTSNRVGSFKVPVPAAFAAPAQGPTCAGGHTSRACAYVYGWAMARADAALPGLRSPGRHRFWIDVEAVDDWNDDQLFNQAVLEGMVAAFTSPASAGGVGTSVGIYSDRGEWTRIIGRLRTASTLDRLDEWLAIGPASHAAAVDALLHDDLVDDARPLTAGGRISMVQYLDGAIDRDLARPAAAAG